MRNLIILVIVGLLVACSTIRDNPRSLNDREIALLYKIKKIKAKKSFYVIYAVRNDSTFKIISNANDTAVFDCEKIKVGKSYLLGLKVIFPSDSLFGKPVAPNLGIRSYVINNGEVIILEEKSHNKIYTALNLSGLYIEQ